jgi:beta-glucuronidase
MPGSHPEYGNAEPVEYLCQNLKQLKESNCVLTRFHWQQDDAVYDWCNRNGMLVQEEIPHWGKVSVIPGRHEIEISKQHVEDMMKSHYNHPSIVMWGVGNELHGQAKEIHELVKELKSYIKERDSLRPVNYVTNTIFEGAATDATSLGDILMINEYIGTWHGDRDEIEELDKIVKENPNRPLIISEFGLCEPAFSGGDRARSELFERKMKIYSKYPQISGIINFCLNDYRTQMGEEGKHQFRRRVHGSVDVFGEPKPSYYKVQEYCSPLKVVSIQNETGQFSVELKVKDTLPSYMVEGYELVIWKEKQLIERIQIPSLKPSEVWKLQVNHQVDRMQIVRPNQSMVQEFIIE